MDLLIIHFRVPQPDTNSGEFRLFEILRILADAGHKLTLLASEPSPAAAVQKLESVGVHCVFDEGPSQVAQFFGSQHFDCAIISQYWTYQQYVHPLRQAQPACAVILDTVDLHFVRLQREAELQPSDENRKRAEQACREEWTAVRSADAVWVVTGKEQELLKSAGIARVEVVPNIHQPHTPLPGLAERSGLVFLGYYRHRPNADAVHYFMREVFPRVRQLLPDVPFTIAGDSPPDDFQAYVKQNRGVTVTGFIQDHRSLLARHRLGIAPLRYGAGMKGKICEYFACGLPCVTTSIGAEGMGLANSQDALVADLPDDFARAVARGYTDEQLWKQLSRAGLEYVESRLSPSAIRPIILGSIADAVKVRHVPSVDERITQLETLMAARAQTIRVQQEKIRWRKDKIRNLTGQLERVRNHPAYKAYRWLKQVSHLSR